MSTLRTLERNVVRTNCYKQNCSTKNFHDKWKEFRTAKYGDNTPVNTMPKKRYFYDKKDQFINALRYQKMKIQEFMAQKKAEREAENSEVVKVEN